MFYDLNMVDQNSPKAIEIRKFYFVHDGSKTGHPGFVVWKDDEANRYLVVRFDSDKFGDVPKIQRGVRHITMLSHPTSPDVRNSYVHNRPMLCKRKDIGGGLPNLSIHKGDDGTIRKVAGNAPEMSPSLRKKRKK